MKKLEFRIFVAASLFILVQWILGLTDYYVTSERVSNGTLDSIIGIALYFLIMGGIDYFKEE